MAYKVNLLRGEASRIADVMDGPWRDIRVVTIGAEPLRLISSSEEYAGFVIDGSVSLAMERQEDRSLTAGGAFALPSGGDVVLTSAQGARLLLIVMTLAG